MVNRVHDWHASDEPFLSAQARENYAMFGSLDEGGEFPQEDHLVELLKLSIGWPHGILLLCTKDS
ncbi:hypothetical protein J6590_098304 [Homalodisca vitripennis]|nr:hypothetical protein J6590_098304 [Homalodisca vitripennis]